MAKINCWEFMDCGRQTNGSKTADLGVCPASIEIKAHGINEGKNGGRACWAIPETLCGGDRQGSFAEKVDDCLKCKFYHLILEEQIGQLSGATEIISKLEK